MMKQFLHIIILISCICSCSGNHLSKKEYTHILDSLKQIELPLVFDLERFFKQSGDSIQLDSVTFDNIIIIEYKDSDGIYRKTKHKDSLFWDRYEYKNERLYCYYREYFNSCGDIPTGYVIYYDPEGKIDHFCNGFWEGQQTGLYAKYNIYNIINKLEKASINLLEHTVLICYTNITQKRYDDTKYEKYYWAVGIDYYDDNKNLERKHMLRISPETGEVLEDWIEEW